MKQFLKYLFFFIWICSALALLGIGAYMLNEKYKEDDISWTLSSYNGDVSLADFKEKIVMIYFGFTHCPDICPTSLYTMSHSLDKLSEKEKSQIVPIFVSVDPDRDNVELLKEYSQYFNKSIIGLTSNKENLDKVTKKYNAFYSMVPMKNSSLKYTVSHTTRIYIVDKNSKLRFSVDSLNQNADYISTKLKLLLDE